MATCAKCVSFELALLSNASLQSRLIQVEAHPFPSTADYSWQAKHFDSDFL